MRRAPPVSLRCSGGVAWRGTQTLLYTVAMAALAAWWLQRQGWPVAWAALPASKVAVLAWVFTRPQAVRLTWDGQAWQADGVAGRIDVALDLGRFLLLRWRPTAGGRGRWLPLTATEAGAAWHGLRVAAYSRVP